MRIAGFLRGIVAFIIIFLLFLTISLFVLASVGATFSTKEKIMPIAQDIVTDQIPRDQLTSAYNNINAACKQQKTEFIESEFEMNQTFKINCTDIQTRKEAAVKDIYKNYVVGNMLDKLFSAECNGLECLNLGPQGWLSKSFNELEKKLVNFLIIGIIILSILLFLLTKGLSNKLIALGIPSILAGLPFLFLNTIKSKVIGSLPTNSVVFSSLINELFKFLSSRYIAFFISGIILIITGLILKFTTTKRGKKKSEN